MVLDRQGDWNALRHEYSRGFVVAHAEGQPSPGQERPSPGPRRGLRGSAGHGLARRAQPQVEQPAGDPELPHRGRNPKPRLRPTLDPVAPGLRPEDVLQLVIEPPEPCVLPGTAEVRLRP